MFKPFISILLLMKISYQVMFLLDHFVRDNMSLLTFSKPMYNKSIMPNVDDSKDMYVLIKSTT